jgi:serine/threonine protein kinase
VSSASDFNKINSKIGDVRPYNIFINEEGQIKIANLYSWPYERTNFEKTTFEKTLTYLAPEELRIVAKGIQDNNCNKVTAESFSIGLTLLQSGLLFNARELYSMAHFSLDLEKLNRHVAQWHNLEFSVEGGGRRKYSPLLRNIVASMCNADDRERLTSLQVEEVLRPHQN